MSDLFDILLNPRRWWPVRRRNQFNASEGWFIQRTRTSAEVAEWCKMQFADEEVAMKHYLRIERRLGRLKAMLGAEFHLTAVHWSERRTMPGDFMFRDWFRRLHARLHRP